MFFLRMSVEFCFKDYTRGYVVLGKNFSLLSASKNKYLLVSRGCVFKSFVDFIILFKYRNAMQPNTKTHKIEAKVTKTYNGINSRLFFCLLL